MENSQFSLHPPAAKMGTKAESYSFPPRFGQKHEQPLQAGAGLQGQLVTEKEQLEYLILQNNQDPDRTGNSAAFHSRLSGPAPVPVEISGNVAIDFSGRRIRFLNPRLSLSRTMYQRDCMP